MASVAARSSAAPVLMCCLHPEVTGANLAPWLPEAIPWHCCLGGSVPSPCPGMAQQWLQPCKVQHVPALPISCYSTKVFTPHQNAFASSVLRVKYHKHKEQLWPKVASAGVEEILSMSPAGTVSRLSLPWEALFKQSLSGTGCQTWCHGEIPSNIHHPLGLCGDSVITGCHRKELSVSSTFRMKHVSP